MINGGSVVATNSTFAYNRAPRGGAIQNWGGSFVIDRCTFVHNTADIRTQYAEMGAGGAMEVSGGTVQVLNSTFYSNTTTKRGGALDVSVPVTVTNSTFVQNSADGALYALAGQAAADVRAAGETVHGNVIRTTNMPTGTVLLRNSLLADNGTGDGCLGSVVDGGGNLYWQTGDATCPGLQADPQVGALAENGGPTATVAIGSESAARQLGDAGCPVLDQRGLKRFDDPGQCDAGAYTFLVVRGWLPAVAR